MLNPDFRDMLSALCAESAEFLLVGAYALAAHGLPYGRLDSPFRRECPTRLKSLAEIRGPLSELTIADLKTPNLVLQIGVAPRRIDILTSIDGVEFDEAWPHRKAVDVEGLSFAVIGRSHLIQNKKAVGRSQDLADVAWLERAEP